MKKTLRITLIFLAGFLVACKKDQVTNPDKGTGTKPSTRMNHDALNLIKDSIYLYAKETYLWYDQLPAMSAFNPHSFSGSTDQSELTSEVDALSQFAINTATGKPYEYYKPAPGEAKYSFIDDGSVSAELGGTKGDFGFSVFYNDDDDLRIKYVYPNSPADKAGLKRGYQVTDINGHTDLNAQNDDNLNFVVNALFGSKPVTMKVTKPNGTTANVSLNTASYTTNPVLTYKVINEQGGKKRVGYLVFNTFTVPGNATPQLQKAFGAFSKARVNELVVDLRYNGGGSLATAEILDNYIVPFLSDGLQMYTYYYNDQLQQDNHPLLSKIYKTNDGDFLPETNWVTFTKMGNLDLKRVFFIVTGSTASASELTINNLRPVMDVKLIGQTSYGKPVGFFAIDINKFQLYTPQFETRNSAHQGGYYSGMTPGSPEYPGKKDFDDVTKDFGDTSEVLLKHALNFITKGTFDVAGPKIQSLSKFKSRSEQQVRDITIKLDKRRFTGMVGDRTFHRR